MHPEHCYRRFATSLLIAVVASLGLLASAAGADTLASVASVTPWGHNASPVAWSATPNRIFYNSLGGGGMFDGYSANPDGSDPQCLTCSLPSFAGVGTATNRGIASVSPDGKYMLVTVERGDHLGTIGASWTQPGKGGANDVWLYTTDGQHAWPLTNINGAGQQAYGTMWPRFDRTGNELVWSSMTSPAMLNLGYWQLKVANIVWSGGVPSLSGVRTIAPSATSYYEPYGFTPDDQHILFASDVTTGFWLGAQIDTIGVDGSGLTALTQPPAGVTPNYNEFAFYTPGDSSIIYGTTRDATSAGLDYWIMNPNGSGQRRLTYLNEPWNTESMGYSITEFLAFNPNNANQFITGVASDSASQNVNAEMVNLDPAGTSRGLTESFYSGTGFNQFVSSTTQNPSSGFNADGSPAAGVPSTIYSIKWTGSITFPASGSYSLCVAANPGAQLLLGGHPLVYAWFTFGARKCATVAETAGATVAIEEDYVHSIGLGNSQLSWITPGQATPALIPSAQLSPSTN